MTEDIITAIDELKNLSQRQMLSQCCADAIETILTDYAALQAKVAEYEAQVLRLLETNGELQADLLFANEKIAYEKRLQEEPNP